MVAHVSATTERSYGLENMTASLRRVLVHPPREADLKLWREYGWRSEPDAAGIAREHEAVCELLAGAGAEVVLAETPVTGDPDAIYVYDPALISDEGAILLRPGKAGRREEPGALGGDLVRAGVPNAVVLEERAEAEGGGARLYDQ